MTTLVDMSRIAISRVDAHRMLTRGDRDRELVRSIERRLQLLRKQQAAARRRSRTQAKGERHA